MCKVKTFFWNRIVASTTSGATRLVKKARALRVLVIGENIQALTEALAFSVEHMESVPFPRLSRVLARSATRLEENEPFLEYGDQSYDLCIVSFSLHQLEPEVAEAVVREALRIAPNALLIDFALAERNIELPSQYLCSLAEQFLHQGTHWDTYKHYIRVGALHGIAHRAQSSEFDNITIWGGGIRLLLVG